MPNIGEVQVVKVQAKSGTYTLTMPGYGSTGPLDYINTASASTLQSALNTMFNITEGITVDELREVRNRVTRSITYVITFGGELAGQDIPELIWEDKLNSNLEANEGASASVMIDTTHEGTTTPKINIIQTLELDASVTGGEFYLTIDEQTVTVPFDATADDLLTLISPILNPNNIDLSLPHTRNVQVFKFNNVFHIVFQGEHSGFALTLDDVGSALTGGTVTLDTRTEGINYYEIESLNIDLGSAGDVFNIQSTRIRVKPKFL